MKSPALALSLLSLSLVTFSFNAQADGGETTYNKACKMCHASGAMGAPMVGKKVDWEARLAKGIETLETNSINGFRGFKGMMPARGGYPKLTDDEVKAAVAFMVSSLD